MSTTPAPFDLTAHGLTVAIVHHNLPASALYEHAIRFEKDASIAENGALIELAGLFTKSFETYAAGVSAEVKASAPKA